MLWSGQALGRRLAIDEVALLCRENLLSIGCSGLRPRRGVVAGDVDGICVSNLDEVD